MTAEYSRRSLTDFGRKQLSTNHECFYYVLPFTISLLFVLSWGQRDL